MAPSPDIAAVILAAGASRRFGGAKQLATLDGRTLVEHVLDLASEAGLATIVAVVPAWLTSPASRSAAGVIWVRNPDPARGLSHSLRLTLAALPPAIGAIVILLGDQPTMARASLDAVLAARGRRPIVAAHDGERPAHPLIVERSVFGLLTGLQGDIGLRDVLAAHPELVHAVAVARHPPDVDRHDDLERLSRSPSASAPASARIGHMFDSGKPRSGEQG